MWGISQLHGFEATCCYEGCYRCLGFGESTVSGMTLYNFYTSSGMSMTGLYGRGNPATKRKIFRIVLLLGCGRQLSVVMSVPVGTQMYCGYVVVVFYLMNMCVDVIRWDHLRFSGHVNLASTALTRSPELLYEHLGSSGHHHWASTILISRSLA